MNSVHRQDSAETAVYDKVATQLDPGTRRSQLLDEAAVAVSFSPFFSSTWAFHEDLLADQDLRKPDIGMWLTPLVSDEPPRGVLRSHGLVTFETQFDPVQKVNSDRVAFLARKYVSKGTFSDEESARLSILTERVRQLLPAVTAREYEALEELLKKVNQVSESNAAIRRSLAIEKKKND